jgi:copper chaperone NosL
VSFRNLVRSRPGAAFGVLLLLVTALALSACGGDTATAEPNLPVEITREDDCHVCGMIVAEFPGPKGQAYERGDRRPLMFCSTLDMFAYLLQPEAAARVQEVYVHDMAVTEWEQPATEAFIDARSAWYVVGHSLRGAMGHTLASFETEEGALAFAAEYGGEALRFEDITLELIASLGEDMHHDHGAMDHGAHGHMH